MKKIIFLLIIIFPFLVTSCKKKPVAAFSYEISYNNDNTEATVLIKNNSVNADHYTWNLFKNDDEYFHLQFCDENPRIALNKSGQYRLELKAFNSKDEAKAQEIFTVLLSNSGSDDPAAPPTAAFNINSTNGSFAPTTINCTNTSSNATHYLWTLTKPDYTSQTSTEENPSFVCSQTGTYTLILIAYNSDELSSSLTQSFTLSEPSKFTLSYLKLTKIPMTDGGGDTWDTGLLSGADPDIYFKILTYGGEELYTASTKENIAETDFPITWYSVNYLLDYNEKYYIKFYDEDGSLDPDDIMANCIFESYNIQPGSTSYTWTSSDGATVFTVGLTWQAK